MASSFAPELIALLKRCLPQPGLPLQRETFVQKNNVKPMIADLWMGSTKTGNIIDKQCGRSKCYEEAPV